jgi:hypothetical protein
MPYGAAVRNVSCAIAAGFALLLPAGGYSATTVVVAPGPGTPLQDAIDAAAPGTKLILDGTFAEGIVIRKPLTLRGSQRFGVPAIDASSTSAPITVDIESDGVKLHGSGDVHPIYVFTGPQQLEAIHSLRTIFGPDAVRTAGIPRGATVKLSAVIVDGEIAGALIRDSGAGTTRLGRAGIVIEFRKGSDERYRGTMYGHVALAIENSSGILVKGVPSAPGVLHGGVSLDESSTLNRFSRLQIDGAIHDAGSENCGDMITYPQQRGSLAPCH